MSHFLNAFAQKRAIHNRVSHDVADCVVDREALFLRLCQHRREKRRRTTTMCRFFEEEEFLLLRGRRLLLRLPFFKRRRGDATGFGVSRRRDDFGGEGKDF